MAHVGDVDDLELRAREEQHLRLRVDHRELGDVDSAHRLDHELGARAAGATEHRVQQGRHRLGRRVEGPPEELLALREAARQIDALNPAPHRLCMLRQLRPRLQQQAQRLARAPAQQLVERAVEVALGRVKSNRCRLVHAQPAELAVGLERLRLLQGHEGVRVHVGDPCQCRR
eukprot:2405524-Prymnesium_polylepis.2